jgi:hypothetical protein
MESKVEIEPYQGDIVVVELNNWLQQLYFYISFHNIKQEKNIPFSQLKLEGQALTWWEIYIETLRLEGDPPITMWEAFKTSLSPNFTLLGM